MEAISEAYGSSDEETTVLTKQEENVDVKRNREHSSVCLIPDKGSRTHFTEGYISKRKPLPIAPCMTGGSVQVSSSHAAELKAYIQGDSPTKVNYIRRSESIPNHTIFRTHSHTKAVTSVQFHPRPSCPLLLSSSFDGGLHVWDWTNRKALVATLRPHSSASGSPGIYRAAWLGPSSLITGGFDSKAALLDAGTGATVSRFPHSSPVSTVVAHPFDPHLFASGEHSRAVHCWDSRRGEAPVRCYAGAGGGVLDLTFLNRGRELAGSSDVVRPNATSQALLVWDVGSGAVFSNQLYQEPFTCPALRPHPSRPAFLAQSNAGYIVVLSSQRPYKMSRHVRFQGHAVDGYPVGFDISPDGRLVASGNSKGGIVWYSYHSGKLLSSKVDLHQIDKTLGTGERSPCVSVAFAPSEAGCVVAAGSWDGEVCVLGGGIV